ncbi:CoA transferase [Achromobacter sp. ACM03]|nr:CoA transferase [Achromobacter sp. ACM03]
MADWYVKIRVRNTRPLSHQAGAVLGAEVIAVEGAEAAGESGSAAVAKLLNRGKRSIVADLKTSEGPETARGEHGEVILAVLEGAAALNVWRTLS